MVDAWHVKHTGFMSELITNYTLYENNIIDSTKKDCDLYIYLQFFADIKQFFLKTNSWRIV